MTDLGPFLDIERALAELLGDLGTVGSSTPANLGDVLPYIRVARNGGADDQITDAPRVDIDAFGPDRDSAYDLAQSIQVLLLNFPLKLSSGVIDRVDTDTGPHEVAWGNPNIHRFTAAYRIASRRN